MLNFIIRKILLLIPMMLVISFLIYAGIELMPGDAVDFLLPPDALATMNPQELELLREELGLNDPFLIRYFNWLVGILHGDFGYSIQSGVPVSTLLANTLPATIELSVAALFISTVVGTLLGVISALKKGSSSRHDRSCNPAVPFWPDYYNRICFQSWMVPGRRQNDSRA